jgi:hypothetical protein
MKTKCKAAIILIIAFLFPYMLKAQTTYEDVVYLKRGTVIHGIIIEQVPNKSFTIQTKDESTFVCKIEDIEKITREELENRSAFNFTKVKKHGYINITEASIGLSSSVGVQTVNSYLFNRGLSLGLGLGFNADKTNNLSMIPVFVDFRAYMLERQISPFMAAAIGYSFSTNDTKGGRIVNIGFGMRAYLSSKFATLFSIGYVLQTTAYHYSYYSQSGFATQNIGYLNLKLGVMF